MVLYDLHQQRSGVRLGPDYDRVIIVDNVRVEVVPDYWLAKIPCTVSISVDELDLRVCCQRSTIWWVLGADGRVSRSICTSSTARLARLILAVEVRIVDDRFTTLPDSVTHTVPEFDVRIPIRRSGCRLSESGKGNQGYGVEARIVAREACSG